MPSPGGQFLSDQNGDIEDYFVTDYQLIDQYIGDTLWVWGIGPVGDNTTTTRSTPVTTILGGTNWKSIASGIVHSIAIKTDGTLWLWGSNSYGQLGVNDNNSRTTPVTTILGGNNWDQVVCGNYYTAAIKTDGTLWTWGNNNSGQLATNDNTHKSTPVTTILGGTNWNQVSCGDDFIATIKTDGTLWTWGRNQSGQLGINMNSPDVVSKLSPVTTFTGGTNWKQVDCGTSHIAAIKTDGTLWVWGSNNSGELGIRDLGIYRSTPATTFAGGTNWKQVSCGNFGTAAIKTDGTLWVWGDNSSGKLGINKGGNVIAARSTPVTTFAGGTNWKQIARHQTQSSIAAIKTDGTLWTWGSNYNGTLGVNDITSRSTPVTTILGGNNWKSISNCFNVLAITAGFNVDLS